MLRRLVCGMAAVALTLSVQAARAADDGDISADVRTTLKQLNSSNDRSALSRLNLAKVAIASARTAKDVAAQRADYEAARDVLADAARLEPNNKEVADLMQVVMKNIPPAPASRPAVPAPPTQPAATTKPEPAPAPVARREVTPAEINRIRQIEWRPAEMPKMVVRIDPDVRKKFLASTTDTTPAEFNKLTPDEQAAMILQSPRQELHGGVHMMTDPASIKMFKIAVERVVVQSCATAGCHSNNKAGRFNLYTEKTDAAVYTNFLMLQTYATRLNGTEHLMIDRTNPESSLLLQFLLPSDLADTPHPAAPGFKSPVRTKNDPRFVQILKWLKDLDPIAPQYGIDLSHEPAPAETPKK